MKNYLIKLTPVSMFFFAGEKHFGNMTNTNYFAKSNLFPQQTTLLGMLRKELLIQEGIFKINGNYSDDDYVKINELIGGQSFQENKQNSFGKIKSLSPVFISKNEDNFITIPKDYGFIFKKINGKSNLNKDKLFVPFMENFKAKDGLAAGFISSDYNNHKYPIPLEKVFKEYVKVGNEKEKKEDDKDKFFKQLFYIMIKGFSFSFFAQLDFTLKDSTVFIGGDNSSFKMEVIETQQTFKSIFIDDKAEKDKITLLSNALVDEDIYDYCDFAVTQTVDFRTIRFEKYKYKERNAKYTMIERGSVFFTSNKEQLEMKIENKNFEQIGYNIFK